MPTSSKRKADDAELSSDSNDYNSMKVTELKVELRDRGLLSTGRKAELVKRLEDSDAARASKANEDESTNRNHKSDKHSSDTNTYPTLKTSSAVASTSEVPASKVPKKAKEAKEGWAALSIPLLKDECRSRGISTGGKKPELVTRLEDDDNDKAELADPNYKPRVDELAISSGEKRRYPFVARIESGQRDRLRKAKSQRMCMMGRQKGQDSYGIINEEFDIAGSTGNCYKTIIGTLPRCDCIDFKTGGAAQQCKHIVYCLAVILKVPDDLVCQRAFLKVELDSIFLNAPATQAVAIDIEQTQPGVRKPTEGGECPICMQDFEPTDELVWCKGACGQNIHKECFNTWKSIQMGSYGHAKCPYCRTAWIDEEAASAFAALKATAPKKGWHKNIADLDVYRNAPMGSQD